MIDCTRPHARPTRVGALEAVRALLLALALPALAWAQERREIVNRSGQPWTLALVEGARPGIGALRCVDKFTGRAMGSLAHTGDRVVLPPRSRILVDFLRSPDGDFFRGFLLEDRQGHYAEFAAGVEYRGSATVELDLVDLHVGAPLDRKDPDELREDLEDGIERTADRIIIHLDALGGRDADRHTRTAPAPEPDDMQR